MFRSAAASYGERRAGVLLTGQLDDGAAGLWEIQRQHGATIVQDPDEAAYRSMPENAIQGMNVQYIVRLAEMPPPFTHLSKTDGYIKPALQPEPEIEPAQQACPECGGAMMAARMGRLEELRCHTGHRFGLKSMIIQKGRMVERTLYAALAQSEELTALLRADLTNAGPDARDEIEREILRRVEEQENLRDLMQTAPAAQAV